MNARSETYLLIAPDALQILSDNELRLEDLLTKAELGMPTKLGTDPTNQSSGAKEVVTILLATAALVAASTPLLRRVLASIDKRLTIVEKVCVPVEDSHGRIVTSKAGEPILTWVERPLSSAGQDKEALNIKGFGIEIAFKTESKN